VIHNWSCKKHIQTDIRKTEHFRTVSILGFNRNFFLCFYISNHILKFWRFFSTPSNSSKHWWRSCLCGDSASLVSEMKIQTFPSSSPWPHEPSVIFILNVVITATPVQFLTFLTPDLSRTPSIVSAYAGAAQTLMVLLYLDLIDFQAGFRKFV
jgi:hypothetical protein